MLIFLDIDGVLHPALPVGHEEGKFCHLERFETIMREYPEWKIVISSGWRLRYSLNKLRTFFSNDIADRIVGITPILLSSQPAFRQREIEQYLRETSHDLTPWIALDDSAGDYAENLPNLILCNMMTGIDEAVEERLRAMLVALSSNIADGRHSVGR